MFLRSSSACLGSFQKPGCRDWSSFSAISCSFASMSKIPPQRVAAFRKVFYLFIVDHKKHVWANVVNNLKDEELTQRKSGVPIAIGTRSATE
jgi:hypothetical protein